MLLPESSPAHVYTPVETTNRRNIGCQQHHAVGGNQLGAHQINRITGRGFGNGRMLGLALIEQAQGTAATPSRQYHFFIAQPLFRITDTGTPIQRDFPASASLSISTVTSRMAGKSV